MSKKETPDYFSIVVAKGQALAAREGQELEVISDLNQFDQIVATRRRLVQRVITEEVSTIRFIGSAGQIMLKKLDLKVH
jgi:hypothetical protein